MRWNQILFVNISIRSFFFHYQKTRKDPNDLMIVACVMVLSMNLGEPAIIERPL